MVSATNDVGEGLPSSEFEISIPLWYSTWYVLVGAAVGASIIIITVIVLIVKGTCGAAAASGASGHSGTSG